MIGDSNFPSFHRVFVLHVATPLPMELPTVAFYRPDNVPDFSYHVFSNSIAKVIKNINKKAKPSFSEQLHL
jgi:hypothetical protein